MLRMEDGSLWAGRWACSSAPEWAERSASAGSSGCRSSSGIAAHRPGPGCDSRTPVRAGGLRGGGGQWGWWGAARHEQELCELDPQEEGGGERAGGVVDLEEAVMRNLVLP